jgi:hypothetical protein
MLIADLQKNPYSENAIFTQESQVLIFVRGGNVAESPQIRSRIESLG